MYFMCTCIWFMYTCIWAYICHACAGQTQLIDSAFSPTVWVPGTKLRSSVLAASTIPAEPSHWTRKKPYFEVISSPFVFISCTSWKCTLPPPPHTWDIDASGYRGIWGFGFGELKCINIFVIDFFALVDVNNVSKCLNSLDCHDSQKQFTTLQWAQTSKDWSVSSASTVTCGSIYHSLNCMRCQEDCP